MPDTTFHFVTVDDVTLMSLTSLTKTATSNVTAF